MYRFSHLIPWFPLSVIIFLSTVVLGSQVNLVPSVYDIIDWLYYLYQHYGLPALFVSAVLESIAYIGLYFPSIIVLTVAISNGTIIEYITIAGVTALGIVCGSITSYLCGYYGLVQNRDPRYRPSVTKWWQFVLLNWHPNVVGLWFFRRGLCRQPITPWILYV